jgi:hypothetical protein
MDFSKTFADTKGRSWTMEIGWGTFRRVKAACGIDLESFSVRKDMTEAQQQEVIERFLALIYSSTDFPPVLMAILDSQMKAAGVSDADFMDGFETQESIDAVTNAFRQALADFTRDPLARMAMQKMMQGVEKAQKIAMKRMDQQTEAKLQEMETTLNAKIDLALKNASTDSAESSAATIPSIPSPKA